MNPFEVAIVVSQVAAPGVLLTIIVCTPAAVPSEVNISFNACAPIAVLATLNPTVKFGSIANSREVQPVKALTVIVHKLKSVNSTLCKERHPLKVALKF